MLLTLLIMAMLKCQQNVRGFAAATFDVYQYKVDSDLGKALTSTGRSYATTVRELPKEEAGGLGPPRVHIMNTFLEWVEEEGTGGSNRQHLQDIAKDHKDS